MKKIALLLFALLLMVVFSPAPALAFPSDCQAGYLYSPSTGEKCSSDSSLPPGCLSASGYSFLTGLKCDKGTGSSITILSPKEGEIWKENAVKQIKYKYCVTEKCNPVKGNFKIEMVPAHSSSSTSYLIANTTSSGHGSSFSYDWNVGIVKTSNGQQIDVSPGTYQIRITEIDSNIIGHSKYFDITSSGDGAAPSISSVSGPTTLDVGEKGKWKVKAKTKGNVTYSVIWGDESYPVCSTGIPCSAKTNTQSSSTFTHTYEKAGTYNPTFTVENAYGAADTSLSVKVGGNPSATNTPTTISSVSYNVTGEEYNFTFSANDPDNDDLVWAIFWRGGTPAISNIGSCPSVIKADAGSKKNRTVRLSHSWPVAGAYNVLIGVHDCVNSTVGTNLYVEVKDKAANILMGDVDGNGKVTSNDSLLVQKYIAGTETFYEANKTRADVNSDGSITMVDSCLILNYVAGNISSLPYTKSYSKCQTSEPSATVPSIPTGFTATPGECGTETINLSWAASSGATAYTLTRNGYPMATVSGTTFKDTGLTPGGSYSYGIKASNSAGTSSITGTGTNAPLPCATQSVGGFDLSISPSSVVLEGDDTGYLPEVTINAGRFGGFNEAISLSFSNPTPGNPNFSETTFPSSIPAGKSSVTFKPFAEGVADGVYYITVTGSSGSLGKQMDTFGMKITSQKASGPYVKVLSPNGGEKYKAGDTVDISWESLGINSTMAIDVFASGVIGVGLVYSDYASDLPSSATNPARGSYSWKIPSNFASGNYFIQIRGSNAKDMTDSYITIGSPLSAATGALKASAIAAIESMPAVSPVVLKVSCTITNKLSRGMSGEEVKCLQQMLNGKGYNVPETGFYGDLTVAAVKAFQDSKGLKVDGILGSKTLIEI